MLFGKIGPPNQLILQSDTEFSKKENEKLVWFPRVWGDIESKKWKSIQTKRIGYKKDGRRRKKKKKGTGLEVANAQNQKLWLEYYVLIVG